MKKHLLILFAIVTSFGYFYLNFVSTLSQNVVPISGAEKDVIRSFFPQGWGFFTRNPREPKYKLYELTESNAPLLVNFKITSQENLFGFSRKGSRICMEMIRIQNKLPNTSEWTTSKLDIDQFNSDNFDLIEIDQKELFYIEPGKYIIKEYYITPWNWLKYPDNYKEEYKYYSFELNYGE